MSKTIYLLDTKGDFIAFGAGMFIIDNADNTIKVGCLSGVELAGWNLSKHETPKASAGALAAWIQAIIAAPDGALLRWDDERQQVVDEMAEDEEMFVPGHLVDTYDSDKHQWEAGDWFEVSHFITEGDKERGKGPFQVKQAAARGIEVVIADPRTEGRTICWYYSTQIRPCAAPESTTDTQTGPCAREGIEPLE